MSTTMDPQTSHMSYLSCTRVIKIYLRLGLVLRLETPARLEGFAFFFCVGVIVGVIAGCAEGQTKIGCGAPPKRFGCSLILEADIAFFFAISFPP